MVTVNQWKRKANNKQFKFRSRSYIVVSHGLAHYVQFQNILTFEQINSQKLIKQIYVTGLFY